MAEKGDKTFQTMVVGWLLGLTGAAFFFRWSAMEHARKHFGLHRAVDDVSSTSYDVLAAKIKYLEERVAELEAKNAPPAKP